MGYELAGAFAEHRLPLDALPDDGRDLPPVELADRERDLPGIRAAYRTWVEGENGPVEPLDDDHWVRRFLDRPSDEAFRAVVVREAVASRGSRRSRARRIPARSTSRSG